MRGFFGHRGRPGLVGGSAHSVRSLPIPIGAASPIFEYRKDDEIKADSNYREAKNGDHVAAISLIRNVAMPLIEKAQETIREPCLFVAPHAIEASGENAIPQTLAAALAVACHGGVDDQIVQRDKVYHTGADPMERMIARPHFYGAVTKDRRYTIVDDVSTMGGTIAELAHYIQQNGGQVAHVVLLVNAGRFTTLQPNPKTVNQLKKRYGDELAQLFDIEIAALTAAEAQYLIGFRSLDEIRNRAVAAREETNRRLSSKGILRSSDHALGKSSHPLTLFFCTPRQP